MLRITFLLAAPRFSGGLRVIAIHAAALQRLGHDVTIVTPPLTFMRRLRELRAGKLHLRHDDFGHTLFDNTGVTIKILDRGRVAADRDVPDGDAVIATHWLTVPRVDALSPAKGHKFFFAQGFEERGEQSEDLHNAWKSPFHKIVVSKWLQTIAQEQFGDERVSLVPNSVDRQQFNSHERGKQTVPTVGLLYYYKNPTKGCELCLEAVRLARESFPNLRLVAFGKTKRSRLDLPPGTEYTHDPDQAEIAGLYASCDMWLWGSRDEGFGLPILEAMACRTPVISTTTGASPQILRNGGGVLMESESPAEMAKAMLVISEMADKEWRSMSAAAYDTVRKGLWVDGVEDGYTWDDATVLFERALQSISGDTD